jgi:hypothetical protein
MAFDSLGRYTANHKTWDHVGNMIPVVEYSEGTRPHGEFRPASWLPTQFFDKYFEDYFVIMPGKILACDNDGRLVPAQYGLTGATITYTATDAAAGVIDVRTGVALLAAATGTFNVSAVTGFMGSSAAMAVSAPVGVAPYAFWQWAGDASEFDDGFNPSGLRRHNYNLQHRTALLCDYVLELPLVPASVTVAETVGEASFDSGTNRSTFTALSNLPVAKNTQRTLITWSNGTETDSATRFVVEKDAATDVVAAGDWHIALTTGVVTVYATGTISGNYGVTYSHYASAPTGSNVSKFASALGDLSAGNFLKCNADSNYIVADPVGTNRGTANFEGGDQFDQIVGQVLEVEDQAGKDALDRVRTAYASIGTDASGGLPAYAGQLDQMPGSATGGVSDKIHYAGAANLVVRVNLISR